MNKPNTRVAAAYIIRDVLQGRSLSDSLLSYLPKFPQPRERAFIQALCYGTCRMYCRLNIVLGLLMQKSLGTRDLDVHTLLLTGLYQLTYMQTAPHAAVSETVNAAKSLRKPWAKNLVNAVLRNYLRNENELKQKLLKNRIAEYAHPQWLLTKIKKAWPLLWSQILWANNAQPPFILRVNQQKITREAYLDLLFQHQINAEIISETKFGLLLSMPIPVANLPGFYDGFCSVQDTAPQFAGEFLAVQKNQHVLDACAAPGGKLTHLWEIEPQADYIAVEKDEARCQLIRDNLNRLNAKAEVITADAIQTQTWWNGKFFDRILLDTPCSASGVIRRHPDIKLLRRPADVQQLTNTQKQLLKAVWPLLKKGGLLLYATCSIFPEENVDIIAHFLSYQPDAVEKKLHSNWGIPQKYGLQFLPGTNNTDGFYYSLLQKA